MARSRKPSESDPTDGTPPREVRSWEDLRANVAVLLEAINGEPALARGAAANPVLALEELGYRIAPDARVAIEDRFRFSYRTAARLRALRRELVTIVKHEFDPDSADELATVLFEDLKLPAPVESRAVQREKSRPSTERLPVQVRWSVEAADPLTVLRGKHPIIEPLLEYRQLEASAPRLAPPDFYREIREGRVKSPVTRLRGRLKRAAPPKGAATDA
jgi:hypothetical protein